MPLSSAVALASAARSASRSAHASSARRDDRRLCIVAGSSGRRGSGGGCDQARPPRGWKNGEGFASDGETRLESLGNGRASGRPAGALGALGSLAFESRSREPSSDIRAGHGRANPRMGFDVRARRRHGRDARARCRECRARVAPARRRARARGSRRLPKYAPNVSRVTARTSATAIPSSTPPYAGRRRERSERIS